MTSLACDRRTGHVTVTDSTGVYRLRLPTLREWSDWYDEHEVRVTPGAFDLTAARLNARILAALGAPFVNEQGPGMLDLGDSMVTEALLSFWRTNPLDPWMPYTPTVKRDGKARRPIRTNLTGGLGMRAVLYRALVQIAPPREVDLMELPQIAMLLGVDDPDRDLDDDEDDAEEVTRSGRVGSGARVTRNQAGDMTRMSFRRHPTQPYLFTKPGAIHRRRRPR